MSTVGDIDWDQFHKERLSYVEKVCIVRQHEAIRAALILAQHGLGHLTVAYVRPACEEYLWLAYLNSIDPQVADRLILELGRVDSARSIDAQQEYLGDERMLEYGWPSSYIRGIAAQSDDAKERIEEIAGRLEWPSRKGRGGKGRPPSTKWIASQTDSARLYEFLYSATSRMLHFSPQEILRRGWGDDPRSGNATIRLDSPDYMEYRLDFALSWLIYLLIHTFSVMKSGNDDEQPEEEAGEFQQLFEQWVSYLGQVPIIRPEELNIPQEARVQASRSRPDTG